MVRKRQTLTIPGQYGQYISDLAELKNDGFGERLEMALTEMIEKSIMIVGFD